MATDPRIRCSIAALLVLLAGAAAPHTAPHPAVPAPAHQEELDADEIELMGNAGHAPDSKKPKLTAYFERESYRPGESARLVVTDHAARVDVQVVRTGGEDNETIPNDVMLGTPVTSTVASGAVDGRRVFTIRMGSWPSGVYFAQL